MNTVINVMYSKTGNSHNFNIPDNSTFSLLISNTDNEQCQTPAWYNSSIYQQASINRPKSPRISPSKLMVDIKSPIMGQCLI